MLPLFLMLRAIGLVNSYGGVIVPALASVFGIFLVRQYARSIPDELLEAARLEGAGEARVFASIVLPLLKPILVTLAIFTFFEHLERLHVAADRTDRQPAADAAGRARLAVSRARAGQRADDGRSVVTVLPPLLLFLGLQRYYIQGLLLGSVKG